MAAEITDEEVELACEIMHDAYEAAALEAGWQTQTASRKPWDEVPEANKVTMRAAIRALLVARLAAGEGLREQWGHRYPGGSIIEDSSEIVAKSRAVVSSVSGRPLELMVRRVTDWEPVGGERA
jgi:hypothetical protein